MNAVAEPAASPAIAEIAVAELVPSPTNPRKRVDKAAIADLAASIGKQGVLQPLLVRAAGSNLKGGNWEIICGERRWRACKEAGLKTIPCLVRTLSDVEVLEIQVVENLQRSDLHPLEEAEGYEALVKKHLYTAEDIAAKVGKSLGYVYKRLQLLKLTKKGREWFYAGKLSIGTAGLIAALPLPSDQDKAVETIGAPRHRSDPLSYRDALDYIRREFMLELAKAPFPTDDANLVAGAGSCAACPRRTGNQPQLFEDIKGGDLCTDSGCFKAKRDTWTALRLKEAAAAGVKVLKGKEAKAVMPYAYARPEKGLRSLDEIDYDVGDGKPLRALVGDVLKPSTVMESPHAKGVLVELVTQKELNAALEAKGLRPKRERAAPTVDRAARAAADAKRDLELAARSAVLADTLAKHDGKLAVELLRLLAQIVIEADEHQLTAATIDEHGWAGAGGALDDKKLLAAVKKMAAPDLIAVLEEMLLAPCTTMEYRSPDVLYAIAKRRRIDPKKKRAAIVAAERKAAAAEKPAKKAAKK